MKIIVKTLFGSHLYGTNIATSDADYKIIYQDSLENIILQNPKEVTRVVKDDKTEEAEYIELRKFLRDLVNGQTYAVDMIFTPREHILEKSREWDLIREQRQRFLSKDCRSFIGYCVTQAKVYSDKGRKIRELQEISRAIEGVDDRTLIEAIRLPKCVGQTTKEFIRNGEAVTETYYDIHGKLFQKNVIVKKLREFVDISLDKYGNRGYAAAESLKDWKAIYHAFRVIRELKELATTGRIRFPLSYASELVEIRNGTWRDYKPERLEWEMKSAKADVLASVHLQDSVDVDWVEKFILDFYLTSPTLSNE